jgi:hypothetical protein
MNWEPGRGQAKTYNVGLNPCRQEWGGGVANEEWPR